MSPFQLQCHGDLAGLKAGMDVLPEQKRWTTGLKEIFNTDNMLFPTLPWPSWVAGLTTGMQGHDSVFRSGLHSALTGILFWRY